MLWLSDSNMGTVVIDSAAFLLLIGMMMFTTVYRKRGRYDDRLFFAMLIVDMIAAVCDGLNFFLEESPYAFKGKCIICGDTVFSIAYVIFFLLLILYIDFMQNRDEAKTKKKLTIYAVPAFLTVLIVLGNLFFGYMFYIDEAGAYQYGSAYDLLHIAPIIYLIIIVWKLWKTDKRLFVAFLVLIATRIFLRFLIRGISSTAFIFAVVLAYAHIHVMNEEFYEEAQV